MSILRGECINSFKGHVDKALNITYDSLTDYMQKNLRSDFNAIKPHPIHYYKCMRIHNMSCRWSYLSRISTILKNLISKPLSHTSLRGLQLSLLHVYCQPRAESSTSEKNGRISGALATSVCTAARRIRAK